jgi:hypothetical protein
LGRLVGLLSRTGSLGARARPANLLCGKCSTARPARWIAVEAAHPHAELTAPVSMNPFAILRLPSPVLSRGASQAAPLPQVLRTGGWGSIRSTAKQARSIRTSPRPRSRPSRVPMASARRRDSTNGQDLVGTASGHLARTGRSGPPRLPVLEWAAERALDYDGGCCHVPRDSLGARRPHGLTCVGALEGPCASSWLPQGGCLRCIQNCLFRQAEPCQRLRLRE